jgi:hypothetical protein
MYINHKRIWAIEILNRSPNAVQTPNNCDSKKYRNPRIVTSYSSNPFLLLVDQNYQTYSH